MEEKKFLGIIINLFFWGGLIYWLLKNSQRKKREGLRQEEFNSPENVLTRKRQELGLDVSHFITRNRYPYILLPSFNNWLNLKRSNSREYFGTKNVTVGRSENFFYNILIDHFGDDFIEINTSIYGFYPDIIYRDTLKGIFICIEIDEPYSLKDSQPIHTLGLLITNGKKSLLDENNIKDNAIVKYGWTIIRFSEKQILLQPKACTLIIEYLVNYYSLTKAEFNLSNSEIEISNRWNSEQAIEMAKNKQRNFDFNIHSDNQANQLLSSEEDRLENTKFNIEDYLNDNFDHEKIKE